MDIGTYEEVPEEQTNIVCRHCDRPIKNWDRAYSRSGEHWCSQSCFDNEDKERIVKMRERAMAALEKEEENGS